VFGLNQFYRNRLVRCYLGATRWAPGLRTPHPFTAFDGGDDLPLADLRYKGTDPTPYRGPFPIVNCALNLGGSSDLILHTRHSAPFVITRQVSLLIFSHLSGWPAASVALKSCT